MKSIVPHLADEAVYIIEDNRVVHEHIKAIYPYLFGESAGELTIVHKRSN